MTKTTPTKNGVGRVPLFISPRGLDDPLSPPRRKRPSLSQAPWNLSPSRDQPPSSKSKPASSTTSVKELAVTSVKSVHPKNGKGTPGYTGLYRVTLSNGLANLVRITVHIEKKCFSSPDPATFMMDKTRSVIRTKTNELNVNIDDDPDWHVLMNSEWPWKGLWSLFENEVNKLKRNLEEKTKIALMAHQTKNDAVNLGEQPCSPTSGDI